MVMDKPYTKLSLSKLTFRAYSVMKTLKVIRILGIFLGIFADLTVIEGNLCNDILASKLHVFPDSSTACFWLSLMAMNFTDTEAQCQKDQGYLAYIPDSTVYDTVLSLIQQFGDTSSTANYFLGYTEWAGYLYSLSGILIQYSNFHSSQPDRESEMCIMMSGSEGYYYDVLCSNRIYGVCSSLFNSASSADTTTEGVITTEISTALSTYHNSECICSCPVTYDLNPKVNLTAEQEAEILEIKQNLTVEKSTLSSSVRRRTSAPDDRKSSQAMGFLGVCFLTFTFGLVVLADCSRIINLMNCERK
ncbi:uncharacterized protein LOC134263313 [Saccostrea cucullata]|uniref:uncharacterized protein LOC134263313 n=1 Tax=Saccostrea cuccullata TaxID=36930 RepID=UPI002ED2EE7D